MALASQSGRPVSHSRYMYRRRRNRMGKWLALFVVLGIAALIVWGVWPGPKDTLATTVNPEPEPTTTTTPTITTTPTTTRTTPAAPTPGTTTGASQPTTTPIATTASVPAITTATPSETYTAPVPEPTTTPSTGAPEVARAVTEPGRNMRVTEAVTLAQTDPFTARAQLTSLVASGSLNSADAAAARTELTRLGELLLFDPSLVANDPFARRYVVQSGDSLARIVKRDDINAESGMIEMMNRLANPNMIGIGQGLKVPIGTFHAVVSKSDFVMDLYLENDEGRIIVASYPVGLGEFNGTPTGRFQVRKNSKLKNPQWRNPRTGEFFLSDDPMNPIGERWIGLAGIDETNAELTGYGIHGTIDPDSIGDNRSMGCIRLLDPHVRIVYDALTSPNSTIEIRP